MNWGGHEGEESFTWGIFSVPTSQMAQMSTLLTNYFRVV